MSEVAAETVLLAREGALAQLTLNRPAKLNALNIAMFERIDALLDELDMEAVECLLLVGAGRSFCAGHDLDDLADGNEGGLVERYENRLVERIATLPFPVVAAVRGHCYTGGLELVLAADIIVASDDARFADTHAKFDLVPIWGLTQRLPRRVGMAKAREMMFASRSYDAGQAEEMGLVNLVSPASEFDETVDLLCRDIIANSARSNRAIKKLMIDTDGLNLAAGNAWELHHSPGHGPAFAELLKTKRKGG